MAEVKVLVEGEHRKVESDVLEINAASTVSLIKTDKNIIVDTGTFSDRQKIIDALAKENLKPEDIDIVILTHCHLDHTVNVNLFTNAKVYYEHKQPPIILEMDAKSHSIKPHKEDDLDLAKDVKIFSTPGHMQGHVSVLVQTDNGKVVIAGDAISKESGIGKVASFVWNEEEYLKNQKKILEMADYVIPGHEKMFKVKK